MYRLHGAIHAYGGTTVSARSTADSVISALTPAAWYRNATDVVSSGGFASIWADYASSANGLVLPGVAGNYASTPDAAALDITDDIDILVRVALSDYSPAAQQDLVNKTSAYGLYIKAGATALTFLISGVAEYNSTASPTVTDGTAYWLRVTRVRSTGKINFYQADDSASVPSSWTQVGAEVSGSTGAMPNSAIGIVVGSATGTVFRAIVKSGVGGTTVFDADFSAQAIGTASFTESSSNAATVTINTSGAAPAHIGKARDLLQGTGTNQPAYDSVTGVLTFDGVDNTMFASIVGLVQPTTVAIIFNQISWTIGEPICDGSGGFGATIWQANGGGGASPSIEMYAGGYGPKDTTNCTVGSFHSVVACFDGASSFLKVDDNTAATGNVGTNNAGGFRLARLGSGGGYANFSVKEACVFSSAITGTDLSNLVSCLIGLRDA